jgi:hypothetical protein
LYSRFGERVIGKAAMHHFPSIERMRRAGWREVALVGEAVAALALAAAVFQLLPFRRAIRFASGGAPRPGAGPPAEMLRRIDRSVERAAPRVPWRTVCLQKGLALQWMLRRRGVDARLHYGIGKDEAGDLCAHVWVSVGETLLTGGEQAPQFRTVATYPS